MERYRLHGNHHLTRAVNDVMMTWQFVAVCPHCGGLGFRNEDGLVLTCRVCIGQGTEVPVQRLNIPKLLEVKDAVH